MQKAQGFVSNGNLTVTVGGVAASAPVMGSYPQATVTIYAAGTLNLSTIYSDNGITPKANPFTAATNGYFFFYAANGRYDITFSAGGLSAPLTFGDFLLADPFASGGAVTSFNGRTGAVVPATNDYTLAQISGFPSAVELQYLRRKPNNGATAAYEFAALPEIHAADYNFPAQSPSGTLAIGANTVTLSPMPAGVNASSIGLSRIYIAGTGTPEACLITGFTATTITFTCVGTHSAGWTIASATGGIQEAFIYALGLGSGTILTSSLAPATLHGKVTVPTTGTYTVKGGGQASASILRASDYPNGDLFLVNTSICLFEDLRIENGTVTAQTSGAAIHFQLCSAMVSNASIYNGFRGIILDGTSISTLSAYTFYSNSASTVDGLQAIYNGATPTSDTICIGCRIYNVSGTNCVRLQGADSFLFVGGVLGFGTNQFVIIPDAGSLVVNVGIYGVEMDTPGVSGIVILTLSANAIVADVIIQGCKLLGEGGLNTTQGIDIGFEAVAQANILRVVVDACTFFGWGTSAIAVGPNPAGAYQSHRISGCHIYNSNTNNVAGTGAIRLDACNGVAVTDNVIAQGATQYFGILFSTSAANLFILANDLSQNVTGPIGYNGITPSTSYIYGNKGIDDLLGQTVFATGRAAQRLNYVASETGANNAIAGALTYASTFAVPLLAGLTVTVKLAHTLQAGANTFNLNGGGAVSIKSSRNSASNIGTAYAATGVITLLYDGAAWLDLSQ